jgi:hypothetical protein
VQFTVPAGQFTSATSAADANQQALNYLNANGQAYANTNGTCTAVYSGPCTFSAASGSFIVTSGVSATNNAVSGYLVFAFNQPLNPYSTYTIANIGSSCRPTLARSFNTSSNGKNYTVTVAPNGNVSVMLLYGSAAVPANTTVSITLNYTL